MREMSFGSYLKVNYQGGVLPGPTEPKYILLNFLPWIMYFMPVLICSFDALFLILSTSGCAILFMGIIKTARNCTNPSIYKMFPISPAKKVLYAYFGDLILCLLEIVVIMAMLGVWMLIIMLIYFIFGIVDTAGSVFGLYLGVFMTPGMTAGIVFFALYFFMGFGWMNFITSFKSKKVRIISDIVFYVLHAAVVAVIYIFSMRHTPAVTPTLMSTLSNLPYLPVFFTLYALTALTFNLLYFFIHKILGRR